MPGTDGEKALSEGFGRPLPFAMHLMCDIHVKDNIDSKLSELGIRAPVAEEYRADIFGKNLGSIRRPGLIDLSSAKNEIRQKGILFFIFF